MAVVEKRVCDIDGRDENVKEVTVIAGRRGGHMDICDRCFESVKLSVALTAARSGPGRPARGTIVKTELPPQPS